MALQPFQYYICDLDNGEVKGTNEEQLASELAQSEDYFVIDARYNQWITCSGIPSEIEEFKVK